MESSLEVLSYANIDQIFSNLEKIPNIVIWRVIQHSLGISSIPYDPEVNYGNILRSLGPDNFYQEPQFWDEYDKRYRTFSILSGPISEGAYEITVVHKVRKETKIRCINLTKTLIECSPF